MNGKRSRGRSGRNKPSNPRNQTFDSSGPDGKVRGSANQVFEKYLAMARDAQSSGDRISAENYFQHAEHYYRILNVNQQSDRNRPQMNGAASGGPSQTRGNGRDQAQTEDPANLPQPETVSATEPENGVAAQPKRRPPRNRKSGPRDGGKAEDPSPEQAET